MVRALPDRRLSYGKIVSRDYAVAVCKAYNDWFDRNLLKYNPRFKGMAIIPMQDPEEAAKELRRSVTELGMLGAMMPSNGLAQPLGAKQYLAHLRGSQPAWLLSRRSRRGP